MLVYVVLVHDYENGTVLDYIDRVCKGVSAADRRACELITEWVSKRQPENLPEEVAGLIAKGHYNAAVVAWNRIQGDRWDVIRPSVDVCEVEEDD